MSNTGRPGRRRGGRKECRAEMRPRPAVPRRAGGCTTRRGGGALCQIYFTKNLTALKVGQPCECCLRSCCVSTNALVPTVSTRSPASAAIKGSTRSHRLRPPSKRLLRFPHQTRPASSLIEPSRRCITPSTAAAPTTSTGKSMAAKGHAPHEYHGSAESSAVTAITVEFGLDGVQRRH